MPRRVIVIGVGNRLRGDDAAGLEAVRRLRDRRLPASITATAHEGEAIELQELWDGADAVVLVDALSSDAPAGTVRRFDASHGAPASALSRSSSHAIGIGDAVELGRVLGTLPAALVVYGIEGARFELGAPLSDEVASALDELIAAVHEEALRLAGA